jgi:hypothetical protein
MVSRTIGKGGAVLKELRELSGVQKIDVSLCDMVPVLLLYSCY